MIGDGGMTTESVRLTSIDSGILAFCRKIADEFKVDLCQRDNHPAQYSFIRRAKGGRDKNPIKLWLNDCEVFGKSAYDKRIPACVWSGGRLVWAAFLSGYLDTDGCVSTSRKGDWAVIWVSANRELLADCQQMLAMLGVQSNLKAGRKTGFLSWRLEVHEMHSIAILRDLLTPVHSMKAPKLAGFLDTHRRLGAASSDRFGFDPISMIERLEPQRTFGMEVEGTHTHITNGLITHNTSQESRWLDMGAWMACAAPPPDLTGRMCYVGLDLASVGDVAAAVALFPPIEDGEPWWVLCKFYVPGDNLIERGQKNRAPYDTWRQQGWLTATDGNVIDYARIEADMLAWGEQYQVRQVGMDPWNAQQMSQNLTAAGLEVWAVRQTFAGLSAATKELERLVLAGQVGHGGNPVLRWMVDNVTVQRDANANIKPDKRKSRNKIDGVVALVNALDRAMRKEGTGASVYESRGVIEI
jgi:hypothetical protein